MREIKLICTADKCYSDVFEQRLRKGELSGIELREFCMVCSYLKVKIEEVNENGK